MLIRYVIGRPIAPAIPITLKRGGVSTDRRRDTTEALYLRACEAEELIPDNDYADFLRQRDLIAWTYRLDMNATQEAIGAALYDAKLTQKQIAKAPVLPQRNGWACQRCRWRQQCDGDHMAQHVYQWLDVIEGRKPTALAVKHGRNTYKLQRNRPGFIVSPSELAAYLTCPRLWHLEYNLRVQRRREGKKALPMIRGSLTHEALRILTSNPDANLRTEVGIMVNGLVSAGQLDPDAQADLLLESSVQAIADRSRAMFEIAMEGVAEVVEHEQRRIMRMPGSKKWLHGIPDAVIRMEDGRVGILEYKTTSTKKDLPKVSDSYRTNPSVFLYAALVQSGQLAFTKGGN